MEWTTEQPTELGWYWVYDGFDFYMAELLRPELVESFAFIISIDGKRYQVHSFTHFIGPLPEPELPEPPLP